MEFWFRTAEWSLLPPIKFWFNWRYEGVEHVPREGAALVACNHISYFDPLAQGYFLEKAGRRPRFLAKAELYENWLLRRVLDGQPIVVVEDGKPIKRNLHRERLSIEDLMEEARQQQIGSLDEVQWAVLETSGSISFIEKSGS